MITTILKKTAFNILISQIMKWNLVKIISASTYFITLLISYVLFIICIIKNCIPQAFYL